MATLNKLSSLGKKMMRVMLTAIFCAVSLLGAGCAQPSVVDSFADDDPNPFVDGDLKSGKDDSLYYNPDGIEVEVTVEAELTAPTWRLGSGPAVLAQYAMTYLRERKYMYLESIAEDATSYKRVEWFIDGEWTPWSEAEGQIEDNTATKFRIKGMNAVLLHEAQVSAQVGQVLAAPVPVRPFEVMDSAGDTCANYNSHITLSQRLYWYLWNPERSQCELPVQDMTLTVTDVLPIREAVYPEYDRLVEDGKVTAVVLFGQIGDGALKDSDPGFWNIRKMVRDLEAGGYSEVANAPVGRRFSKDVNGVVIEVDLYSPNEFKGLSDNANYANFEKAVTEYEIVAYDGHSMLGASDFWSRPDYPDFYQVFLYGGCLGYQYYVQPIVQAKGGWNNVDIVSSVIAVSANATRYAGPFLARLERAIEDDYDVSWKDMLSGIRRYVGDSTFGVSGVRDNCFTPTGYRCSPE